MQSYLGGASRRLEGWGPAPDNLNLTWKTRIGGGPTQRKADNALVIWSGTGWTGQSTVVRSGDKNWLLIGGYDHNLHRINAATGKVKWQAEWPDVMKGTNTVVANPEPSEDATRIIVVSGSRRGSDLSVGDKRIAPLRAVSFSKGKELWRLPIPKTDNYSQDVDSSPLWYKGVLYAPVEPGYVYALDPFTTEKVGKHREPRVLARSPRLYDDEDVTAHPDLGEANLAIESSPSAIGDVIYITSGAGHVYGLDRRTLKVVWDFKTGSDIDGTPVVTSDNKLLVTLEKQYVDERGGAYLLDPSKPPADAVVWYYPTPTRGFSEWAGGSVGLSPRTTATMTGLALGSQRSTASTVPSASSRSTAPRRSGRKDPGAAKKAPAPVEVFVDRVGCIDLDAGARRRHARHRRLLAQGRAVSAEVQARREGRLRRPTEPRRAVVDRIVQAIDSFEGNAAFESTPLVWNGHVFIGCRDGYLYCLGD